MRRVWQQFSRLNPSVYSAALRGGCCVPPCVADVSIVYCAVCQQFNKRTLLLLLSQSSSKLLKLYMEGAHRKLSGKLFQQFTRRHERENARALFVHCGLNTLNLPLVWLLIVKLKRLSSMATMERDILYERTGLSGLQ